MTPSQLLESIRNQIDETDAAFWSDSEIYRYMSDAEMEFAQKVPCTEATTTDTSVADQREYDRPSDALEIQRITWDSVKLKKINLTDLDYLEGQQYGGSDDTGQVVYYYDYAEKIGLSPIPEEAKTIKYWYLKQPTVLSASSTSFTIPSQYSMYLGDYVLYRMYLKEQMSNQANNHYTLWMNSIEKAQNDYLERKDSDNLRVVVDEEMYYESDLGMI